MERDCRRCLDGKGFFLAGLRIRIYWAGEDAVIMQQRIVKCFFSLLQMLDSCFPIRIKACARNALLLLDRRRDRDAEA